jgi:hypothetical protein
MPTDPLIRRALRGGRAEADHVLRFRARALRRRRTALRAARAERAPRVPPVPPALTRAAGGPGSTGILVAEGDSWFDYPLCDVLRLLEDHYGYDVESVAHKGDRVEDMAYGRGQLEALTRRLEKLLRQGLVPKAVLISGGGNDVAGAEFGMLLNHARSASAGLNDRIVSGVIDDRVQLAYVTMISAITRVCQARLGRRLPILVHGYDYPVPDGRGVIGGWWLLPGPWLEPGFREKGFLDRPDCTRLAARLIDRFNVMLRRVTSLAEFAHVTFVDLRRVLATGASYKRYWANELHPTPHGFELVTSRFAAVLAGLG